MTIHLVLPGLGGPKQYNVRELVNGQTLTRSERWQVGQFLVVHTEEVLVVRADLHVHWFPRVASHRAFDSRQNLPGHEVGDGKSQSQAFAVFLPVRSVGVMGDARKYDWVVSLRAVETIDFMTAHWAHLPYDLLGKVSNRIINEIDGISRVVYDISGKPPATIEWE